MSQTAMAAWLRDDRRQFDMPELVVSSAKRLHAASANVASSDLCRTARTPGQRSPMGAQCGVVGTPCVVVGALWTPAPVVAIIFSERVCACGKRCTNKGHSPHAATSCQSKELVKDSPLCDQCVCILRPHCLRPRHNSERCYKHDNLFKQLAWPLQATHLLGFEGAEPFETSKSVGTPNLSPPLS